MKELQKCESEKCLKNLIAPPPWRKDRFAKKTENNSKMT
jgi:hypothetical protein